MNKKYNIQIISAPSILGLKPTGVQHLPESLLSHHLAQNLQCDNPIITVPTLNDHYSTKRSPVTHCINGDSIRAFSLVLNNIIADSANKGFFSLVLGGDCSILIGIMPALKAKGIYGLIFFDGHADFYESEKSTTGEVADMDLAIITGRGPDLLADIDHQKPYVRDEYVIHIGQRDREETKKYHSQDIKETSIQCFDLETIKNSGTETVIPAMLAHMHSLPVDGYWIHFDTDVIADELNPAVDYRLPGGLSFGQCTQFLNLLKTGKAIGLSVTIFNPSFDKEGTIAQNITNCLTRSFAQ